MGSALLLLAVLVIVALLVWAADRATKDEVARYAWRTTTFTDPVFREVELTARVKPGQALLALDAVDLTGPAAGDREACAFCVARVAHTDAACVDARQRWGEIDVHEARWWLNTGRGLRGFLATVAVAP